MAGPMQQRIISGIGRVVPSRTCCIVTNKCLPLPSFWSCPSFGFSLPYVPYLDSELNWAVSMRTWVGIRARCDDSTVRKQHKGKHSSRMCDYNFLDITSCVSQIVDSELACDRRSLLPRAPWSSSIVPRCYYYSRPSRTRDPTRYSNKPPSRGRHKTLLIRKCCRTLPSPSRSILRHRRRRRRPRRLEEGVPSRPSCARPALRRAARPAAPSTRRS
jgi:hypothetical protein